MKKVIAILLLSGFVLQAFSQLMVIAGFELNRGYISQHLCVNRDNPNMNCRGKCFLTKELHQDQHRKNQENENTGNRMVIFLFSPEQPYLVPTPDSIPFLIFENKREHYRYIPVFGLLRPPQHTA